MSERPSFSVTPRGVDHGRGWYVAYCYTYPWLNIYEDGETPDEAVKKAYKKFLQLTKDGIPPCPPRAIKSWSDKIV